MKFKPKTIALIVIVLTFATIFIVFLLMVMNPSIIHLDESIILRESIKFTPTGVTISDDLLSYPTEDNFTFVRINITLENIGNKPARLNLIPGHLKADGLSFSGAVEGGELNAELQPGQIVETYIIYNMQKGLAPEEFSLKDGQIVVCIVKLNK